MLEVSAVRQVASCTPAGRGRGTQHMTQTWLLPVTWFVAGVFATGAFWYYLAQRNYHGALWTAYIALVLVLLAVALHIRNDLVRREGTQAHGETRDLPSDQVSPTPSFPPSTEIDRPSVSQTTTADVLRDLRQSLAKAPRGAAPAAASDTPDVDRIVRDALSSLRQDLREQDRREVAALRAELEARDQAGAMDREFQPRLVDAVDLIRLTIERSAEAGLVEVKNISPELDFSEPVALTTYVMEENQIEEEQTQRSMRFDFADGMSWVLHLKLGMVKSPEDLAASRWDAETDRYYPMLRIRRRQDDQDVPLATVFFRLEDATLSISVNALNALPQDLRAALLEIGGRLSGSELVSTTLVELLKAERLGELKDL